MKRVSRTRDPDTALIVTQNEKGEIVDIEIINVMTAYFSLFHGPNAPDPDREPYTGLSWWESLKVSGVQSEQGSD
jgi:hypothetical protein